VFSESDFLGEKDFLRALQYELQAIPE